MAKQRNDDLFAESTMSFGDHLEELRAALFKSIIWLLIGALGGLFVAKYVVDFIQTPLRGSLERYYFKKALDDLDREYDGEIPPEVLTMVLGDGEHPPMIPSTINIDLYDCFDQLKANNPGDFGKFSYSRYHFIPSDVKTKNVKTLCKRLAEANREKASEAPVAAIFDALNTEQQTRIQAIAALDAEAANDKAVRREVVMILNSLLKSQTLAQSETFQGDDFSRLLDTSSSNVVPPVVRRLWEKFLGEESGNYQIDAKGKGTILRLLEEHSNHQLREDGVRRLNQLLITAVNRPLIRQPHLNLVKLTTWKKAKVRVQSLEAHEVFTIWLKAVLVIGAVLASPMIFWHIWNFVASGLYPHEKNQVYFFLPFSIGLFLAGAILAFGFVFPTVLDFLFSFNRAMNIDPDPRISKWLSFVLFLPVGFGIAFQLPLIMLFMERIGIFTTKAYLEKWRIAILIIFVASMLLTPADPISMLLMAIPLTALYFLGIILCRWLPKHTSPFGETN